jgi:hypothetical protein
MLPRIQVVFGMLKETNKAKVLQLAPELPYKFTHVRLQVGRAGIHKFPLALLSHQIQVKKNQPIERVGRLLIHLPKTDNALS